MKCSFFLTSAVCAAIPLLTNALTPGPEFVRLNKSDAVRSPLPLDSQFLNRSAGGRCSRSPSGPLPRRKYDPHILISMRSTIQARDYNPTEFRNNIIAHAAIAKLFDLPIVLTTSAEQGPNGPLPKEILEVAADAPYIQRHGEVDAWDNAEFRKAVRATGKSQIILAGITTDVCPFPKLLPFFPRSTFKLTSNG